MIAFVIVLSIALFPLIFQCPDVAVSGHPPDVKMGQASQRVKRWPEGGCLFIRQ
jgi:hypothetical protein